MIDDYGKLVDVLILENADDKTASDAAKLGQWTEPDFLSGGGGDESLTFYKDGDPSGLLGSTSAKQNHHYIDPSISLIRLLNIVCWQIQSAACSIVS